MNLPTETLQFLMQSGPLPGTLWTNSKGGVYAVVGTAIRESDLTVIVTYRGADGIVWARTLSEFRDGRFQPIPQQHAPVAVAGKVA